MNEERENVYQILELGKHIKNLHHKKGFGGLLFIDLSMIKFSKLSSYIRQLDKENQELKEKLDKYENPEDMTLFTMWCTEKVKDENGKLKKQLENKYEKVGTLTNEILYEENTKLVEENQKLKQVNEEHRMLNGQLREEIKTKDKAYKAIVEELTEYAEENEKLKTQLSGTTFCYDEKEHRDLKVKIKELERIIELCHLDAKETLATINYEQESQQKEFVNYLQRGINHYTAYVEAMDSAGPSIYSNEYDNSKIKIAIYKGILQKYREIVNGTEQN